MPSFLDNQKLNFYKFHIIGSVILSFKYCQTKQSTFPIPPDDNIQSQLKNLPMYNLTDSFVALARDREARKSIFDKISTTSDPIFGMDLSAAVDKFGVLSDRNQRMIPVIVRDCVSLLNDSEFLSFFFRSFFRSFFLPSLVF